MSRSVDLGIVGATGAVGREALSILETRDMRVGELRLFASPYSYGTELEFKGTTLKVETVQPGCFQGLDIVLGTTSASVAREWVPQAVREGAVVVDNSSAFRMEPDVPLVVPEVNPAAIRDYRNRRIVANPNCSTIQLVMALYPLHRRARVTRVVVSTYQSTSGSGQKGMDTLSREVLNLYREGSGAPPAEPVESETSPYPHQIAFNALPHIGDFLPTGYTTEEMKMVNESRKILGAPDLRVCVTCVRVPWFACHALSVALETEAPLSVTEARRLLTDMPGVVVEDEPEQAVYPMPFMHAGSDPVYVGRLRADPTVPNGLVMWVVADNLRKGAALNAVQIAEALVDELDDAAGPGANPAGRR